MEELKAYSDIYCLVRLAEPVTQIMKANGHADTDIDTQCGISQFIQRRVAELLAVGLSRSMKGDFTGDKHASPMTLLTHIDVKFDTSTKDRKRKKKKRKLRTFTRNLPVMNKMNQEWQLTTIQAISEVIVTYSLMDRSNGKALISKKVYLDAKQRKVMLENSLSIRRGNKKHNSEM